MKRLVLISLITGIFSIVFPIVVGLIYPLAESEEPQEDILPEISIVHTDPEYVSGSDGEIKVTLLNEGRSLSTNMHDYLVGVIAAEMPASFETEALKAQTVAARTYAIHKMLSGENESHPSADVCSDITCCQAFCDEYGMREKWGKNYEKNRKKIEKAVLETDGLCAVFEDEPILAVFHSSSCGLTQSSGNIWGSDLPYLIPVESPESEKDVPNYKYSVHISFSEFKDTIAKNYPEATFGDDKNTWIGDAVTDESGRTETVIIGGTAVPGTSLRNLFSLRSTAMDFDITDSGITITTTGYGHGVGLSQYGANALAEKGFSCEDIIAWYYTGTELKNISEILK